MSDIFFRWNYAGQSYAGWYYKYKNKVSGPYDTQKYAEYALMVRVLNSQRGRSDSTTAKP